MTIEPAHPRQDEQDGGRSGPSYEAYILPAPWEEYAQNHQREGSKDTSLKMSKGGKPDEKAAQKGEDDGIVIASTEEKQNGNSGEQNTQSPGQATPHRE